MRLTRASARLGLDGDWKYGKCTSPRPELGSEALSPIDPSSKIALALDSYRGKYALLLGSGVSKAAGIPTSWDVIVDLCGRLAKSGPDTNVVDPVDWYRRNHDNQEPAFDNLTEELGTTGDARRQLLETYFEPPNSGTTKRRPPASAHAAIARLCKLGYVKIVITTNFDRLIEEALNAEGIIPDVVRGDFDIDGAENYVHSRCFLLKLHGDYKDSRLRTSPADLASYPAPLGELLERILEDFGLIVCGWSATYDPALRQAVAAQRRRPYPVFWYARGELSDEARTVVATRSAQVIQIDDANVALPTLVASVEALAAAESPHPLNAELLAARVRELMSAPQPHVILREEFKREAQRVAEAVYSEDFALSEGYSTKDIEQSWARAATMSETLTLMACTLAHADDGSDRRTLCECVERLATASKGKELPSLVSLTPLLLFSYGAAVSALFARNYSDLAALIVDPRIRLDPEQTKQSVFLALYRLDGSPFRNPFHRRDERKWYFPWLSAHLAEWLRPRLTHIVPEKEDFEECFDIWELMLAIQCTHDLGEPPYYGRFIFRSYKTGGALAHRPYDELLTEAARRKDAWGPLQAGLFGGQYSRFEEAVTRLKEKLEKIGFWH
jgi:hypothetical protein